MSVVAVLLGVAFRVWWGWARPGWAFPGYRGMQFVLGVAALTLCMCTWQGAALALLAVFVATLPINNFRVLWAPWERTRWRYANVGAEGSLGALCFGSAYCVWLLGTA